jgi:hypothetical protein
MFVSPEWSSGRQMLVSRMSEAGRNCAGRSSWSATQAIGSEARRNGSRIFALRFAPTKFRDDALHGRVYQSSATNTGIDINTARHPGICSERSEEKISGTHSGPLGTLADKTEYPEGKAKAGKAASIGRPAT